MRVALLGAFAFPVAQGSQRYVGDQARALREAGCEVTLFCYGRGDGRDTGALPIVRTPTWLSPRRHRAGPSLGKPVADLALLSRFASRMRGFDVALAHNAEAALVAQAVRALGGPPVVYAAHAIFAHELPTYAAPRAGAALERLGTRIDRLAVGGADGLLCLSRHAERALGPGARGPVARIPPGLFVEAPPSAAMQTDACARAGVSPGRFAVYAGNLDGYQGLEALDLAAAGLPELPVVLATHDPAGPPLPHLRRFVARSPEDARALVHAARVAVLPRRLPGGFPIKLLGYLEAGVPVVAYASVADTLTHDRSAWLLDEGAGAEGIGRALRAIATDDDLAARLGAEGRKALDAEHAWPALADRTLRLIRSVLGVTAKG